MAERLAYLEAVVGADITQFRKGMRDIRNETGVLSEVTRGVAGLGRTLTFAYTTPLLVLGTTALHTASEFDASMRNINSIAHLSEEALASLGEQTLQFGKDTRSGAIASSEALYTVFSAGITDTADAFSLMNHAVKTAEAGVADLDTTTSAMIAVMLSYGDTSEEMAVRTSDTITHMVAIGVGSMDAFASAIGGLIPAASAAGMEMEEWGANMAFLTQRGLSPAQGAISLNAILKKLISPTEAMQSAFGELGGRNLPELIDQFGSVNEVIEELIENADGDLTKLYAMFNTTQGQRGISQFVAGADAWQQAQEDFNNSVEGATGRAWEQQMMSFAASWDLLKSSIQALGIVIGQSMFPILQPLISLTTDFINSVSSANPELIGLSVAFLAVSASIPPLLWLLGSILTPFGLIAGAAAALATAFQANFAGMKDTVIAEVTGILAELDPLISSLEDFWTNFFGTSDEGSNGRTFLDQKPVPIDVFDFITVSEPMSLWQVYEEYGYTDQFSWQEFVDAALAGGWQGGVVTPDEPIRINPTFEFGTGATPAFNSEDMGMRQIANSEIVPTNLFGDAIDNAMLSVDIMRIQNEFTTLIHSIVPQGSQLAGWIAGTVSTMVVDGLALAIDYVFSGKAGADTSGAMGWIKNYILTPFSDGFTQAIEGSTLDTIITNVTAFKDQIVETFSLEDEANFEGFQSLITSVTSAIDTLTAADWSGVGKLAVILGVLSFDAFDSIAEGTGLVIETMASAVANFANALSAIADGNYADGLALLSGAILDFAIGLLQIPLGIIDALTTSIGNLFGLDLPQISQWFDDLRVAIDNELQEIVDADDTPVINAMDYLNLDYGGSTGTEAAKFFNEMFGDATAELTFTPSWVLGGTGEGAMDWLFGDSGALPNELVIPDMNLLFDPNTITTMMQNLNALIADSDTSEGMRIMAEDFRANFMAQLEDRGIAIPADAFIVPDHIIMPDGTIIQLNQFEFDTTGATPTNPESLVPATTTTGFTYRVDAAMGVTMGTEPIPVDEQITLNTLRPIDLANVEFAVSDAMVNGSSAQEIIDSSFVPIETYWNTMFSAEGTMALSFSNFSTGVSAGWLAIEDGLLAFQDTSMTVMPEITSTLTTAGNNWSTALDPFNSKVSKAKTNVKELMSVVKQMLSLKGMVNVDVHISSSELDGSHAGGLSNVPFDGYVAELHKGERVLTAEENKDYGRVPVGAMSGGSSSSVDNSNVVVNFNGIQDVDAMLFELKRRGYNLGKT